VRAIRDLRDNDSLCRVGKERELGGALEGVNVTLENGEDRNIRRCEFDVRKGDWIVRTSDGIS